MLCLCTFVYTYIGCNTNNQQCENEVDAFLNSYCADLVATPPPPPPPTTGADISPTQCTLTTTVTPTCTNTAAGGGSFQVTIPISDSANSGDQSESALSAETNDAPLLVLGALMGLSVVLLAVVSTGWVCTCLIMKRREIALSSAYSG